MRRKGKKDNSHLPGCLIWIALTIFFLPLALIPMWIFKKDWSVKKKAIISAVLLVCWSFFMIATYSDEEPTIDPVMTQAATAPIPTEAPTIAHTAMPDPTETPMPAETPIPTQEPTAEPTATPTPAPSAVPVLKIGQKSEQVKQMQERLVQLGYLTGSADGDFGSGTKQAVKDFQSVNGLQADGIAGQQTLEIMFSDSAKRQVWVWIPTDGGKKYHAYSGCSNMENPIYVTIEDAISRGFGSCGKCY